MLLLVIIKNQINTPASRKIYRMISTPMRWDPSSLLDINLIASITLNLLVM